MTYVKTIFVTALTVFSLTSGMVAAKTPLPQGKHINNSLMAGVVADIIRKTCPDISARMFVAWSKLNALKTYAIRQGYSEPEVRAFLKDPKEKARVKGMAADYLKARGAVAGDPESYCAVGREEIAKKSLIGQMLRAR